MNLSGGVFRGWRACAAALLAVALVSVYSPSYAQSPSSFPERTVRLLVQYPPAGSVDIAARILAKELTDLWGKSVVVDNKPGASGLIANETLAKAPGDGYTLLLSTNGPIVTVPFFQKEMRYDTLTDLVPVAMVGTFQYVLCASSALKIKTLSEFIAAARARPGRIDYATNGIGGTHHLAWEQLQREAGIVLNHIPFKGAAPALQEVLAGRVSMIFTAVATAFPYIKDGRLVVLASGGRERLPLMPDLATVAESGFPGFDVSTWLAVFTSRGTPPALVEEISKDINKVTLSKSYKDALALRGTDALTSTSKALAELVRTEYERNRTLIKTLGIKVN